MTLLAALLLLTFKTIAPLALGLALSVMLGMALSRTFFASEFGPSGPPNLSLKLGVYTTTLVAGSGTETVPTGATCFALNAVTAGGTPGFLRGVVSGTTLTITSSSGTDTSTIQTLVGWP